MKNRLHPLILAATLASASAWADPTPADARLLAALKKLHPGTSFSSV